MPRKQFPAARAASPSAATGKEHGEAAGKCQNHRSAQEPAQPPPSAQVVPKGSTLFALAVRLPVLVCCAAPVGADAAADAAAVAAQMQGTNRLGGGGGGTPVSVGARRVEVDQRAVPGATPARSTAACWTKPRTSAKGKGSITRRVPTLSSCARVSGRASSLQAQTDISR